MLDNQYMQPGIIGSKHIRGTGGRTIFVALHEDEQTGTYILQATSFDIEKHSGLKLENVSLARMEAYGSFEEAKRAFDDLVYELTPR